MMPNEPPDSRAATTMSARFRGFLPVVVDVETGGFNHETDALLEVAAVLVGFDEEQRLRRIGTFAHHVLPFEGAHLDPKAPPAGPRPHCA